VRRWWSDEDSDAQAVVDKYGPCIDGNDLTEMFVMCRGGHGRGEPGRGHGGDPRLRPDHLPAVGDRDGARERPTGQPGLVARARTRRVIRIWAGMLDSDDPSDAGPAFVYQHQRSA
jgi:hypothetical protein